MHAGAVLGRFFAPGKPRGSEKFSNRLKDPTCKKIPPGRGCFPPPPTRSTTIQPGTTTPRLSIPRLQFGGGQLQRKSLRVAEAGYLVCLPVARVPSPLR